MIIFVSTLPELSWSTIDFLYGNHLFIERTPQGEMVPQREVIPQGEIPAQQLEMAPQCEEVTPQPEMRKVG